MVITKGGDNMPYKPGGGNKPQLYDSTNGEYVDRDYDIYKRIKNKEFLRKYLFNSQNEEMMFPQEDINDREYTELYVEYLEKRKFEHLVPDSKIEYLLNYTRKNDKSIDSILLKKR